MRDFLSAGCGFLANADGMGRGAKRSVPAEGGMTDLFYCPFYGVRKHEF